MTAVIPFILFSFGLAIGSFLNVVIFRYDGERPLFSFKALGGRSHCTSCTRKIAWYDLVPVISFLLLRGRCRYCNAPISFRYPFVELGTALGFLLPYFYFYSHYSFPVAHPYATLLAAVWLPIIALMIIVTGVDMRLMLIPDETVVGLALFGIPLALYAGTFLGPYSALFPMLNNPLLGHMAGAVCGSAALGFIVAVSRGRAMGMGDVKFAGAMGLILGFPDIMFALALSFVLGGAWSIGLLVISRLRGDGAHMKTMVPFGPFMVLGFFGHIFFMEKIMAWYFSLL